MDRGRSGEPERPRRRYQRYQRNQTSYDYDDDYEEYRRRRPRPRRRRRSAWPVLLTGCGIGILATVLAAAIVVFLAYRASQGGSVNIGPIGASPRTFTREDTAQIPLTSISQMLICDKIGNISINVNPSATTATVKTTKIVHKTSQADANQEFSRIAVEMQPPGTLTNPQACVRSQTASTPGALTATPSVPSSTTTSNADSSLVVNVDIPDSSGLLHATSDSVDVTVTLPQKLLTGDIPSMLFAVNAPVGNITIDGLSGLLDIKGNTGNIKITHAILADGSHIETGQGSVTFNGWLLTATDTTIPGRYVFQSEQGNIDVTLPATTNVMLDANTNVGAIHSEFSIPVNNNGGPVNYSGPLNSSASTPSSTKLILDVSTGNVNIHKAQT